MTRDDIIQLAREAELQFGFTGIPALERFARLVAEHERESLRREQEKDRTTRIGGLLGD